MKSLVNEKGWTVVTLSIVKHFETFHEALNWQNAVGGNLMSRTFYETEYRNL